MAYRIVAAPRTQSEIIAAIDYYGLYSNKAPAIFIDSLNDAYLSIASNPRLHRVIYKDVRALKIKKFPYSLFYRIDDYRNIINVVSCFHHKRNPGKRP